jgi:hypothetical protein
MKSQEAHGHCSVNSTLSKLNFSQFGQCLSDDGAEDRGQGSVPGEYSAPLFLESQVEAWSTRTQMIPSPLNLVNSSQRKEAVEEGTQSRWTPFFLFQAWPHLQQLLDQWALLSSRHSAGLEIEGPVSVFCLPG